MAEHPHCRLCLITPAEVDLATFPASLEAALKAGDVASLIIASTTGSLAAAERIAEVLVPIAQTYGVAALVVGDTRLLGRCHADGIHIESDLEDLSAALAGFGGKRIVGAGGIHSRDEAMMVGEREPDYLFFGRLDGDHADSISPKALDLASWWSGLFEIPAIVMGGSRVESVSEAAAAGIEFVALRSAVWSDPEGPAHAVLAADELLHRAHEAVG